MYLKLSFYLIVHFWSTTESLNSNIHFVFVHQNSVFLCFKELS